MKAEDLTPEELAEWKAGRDHIHEAAKRGRLIQEGFEQMMHAGFPMAGESQKKAMRAAFFAGAKHLQYAMLTGVALGDEDDPADEDMMQAIDDELERFINGFIEDMPTAGRA